MSAFIVSDKHINTLVSYGILNGVGFRFGETFSSIAQDPQAAAATLHAANVVSVNRRYQRCETPDFTFRSVAVLPDAITILKACDCFDYQSCEVDDYDNTIGAAIIRAIRGSAIRSLAGYDRAPWGL